MKRILLLALLFAFVLSSSAFAIGGDVKWYSLKDGTAKAKAEKKPMLIDFFYGKGCPRCERLEKGIYTDPQITKMINDDFVPIFIDLTKPLSKEEEDLGNKYDYKNDCLMLFLDPEMNIIKDSAEKHMCFVDDIEPEIFIGYLDMIKGKMKK
ncbi:MAG: thioredoxin family protein [Nitrospirota bacterium]|nr:thioredoxin family protein [Nitrospirota bacterium]